jgi:sulfonate transport system substrate-binding protein
MNTFINKSVTFVFILALAINMAGAGELPKVIRFGVVGTTSLNAVGGKPTSAGTVALAQYLGFFEEEFGKNGPEIQQLFLAGTGPAQNEALAQGSIEFGSYGGVPNVIGLVNGIPAQIVLASRASGAGASYYLAIHPDSAIKTVAELRGKRITVQKGTSPYQFLLYLLEAHGIAESDVTLVNLNRSDALVAFEAGAVDAIFNSAELLVLRDQWKVKILAGTRDYKLRGSVSGTLVNDQFAKTYPDVVARVVKVLVKTAWWASQEKNREQLLQFVASRSIAYQYIKEDYAGSLKERYNPLIDESTVDAFQTTVKFSVQHKLIRREVDEATVRSWLEPRFLQAALHDLQLENYWKEPAVENAMAAQTP